MCGIVGFLHYSDRNINNLSLIVNKMIDRLSHRGPNNMGSHIFFKSGLALAHSRLSIVDTSNAGSQPMFSSNGRYIISFNGEIYNYEAIKKELLVQNSNIIFLGNSDTEVLLTAFEIWGVENTLKKTVGMFAIALWDTHLETLHLIRDRMGEKPLYYGWIQNSFVFGSELKALIKFPDFNNSICRQALRQFMQFLYVPAPLSIYQDIYKLEPGCHLIISGPPPKIAPSKPLNDNESYGNISLQRWWSVAGAVENAFKCPINSDDELFCELEERLEESIRIQSQADVPLGAFLSGGVDSSTVVALMQKQSSIPVQTYTVGIDGEGFDEAPFANAVAKHLGTEHHELRVTAKLAMEIIPHLPDMYDEPFADSSQIPTYLVCKAARQNVTVALSGDAGDELFGGYNRYLWTPRLWRNISWMPLPIRQSIGWAIRNVPEQTWDAIAASVGLNQGNNGINQLGGKLHKFGNRLKNVKNIDELSLSLVSEWQDPSELVRSDNGFVLNDASSILKNTKMISGLDDEQLRMMYFDSITYLPDDILCKVDRAAMANSLETRIPFLDHRLVELSWKLPLHMKIRGGIGKWALREILYKYVPKELIERPKAGFAIPIGNWLRGPLRDWADTLLDPIQIEKDGYLIAKTVQKLWEQHLRGTHDHTTKLWAIITFQAWLKNHK